MYCSKCGKQIDDEAVVCIHCGVPTSNYNKTNEPNNIVINNVNQNTNSNVNQNGYVATNGNMKNKWLALVLCIFLGFLGFHKFYENKILLGIVYALTGGLFGIGVIVDLIALLFKPNPYYV